MPWTVGVVLFTVLVFIIGCAMGIGKAAVYKHIPEYFPHDVGAVGGLVGSLGALGGFFLPPLFAYATAWTGAPQATFGVLFVTTLIGALWMHGTVVHMLHTASPELANKFEKTAPRPPGHAPTAACPALLSTTRPPEPNSRVRTARTRRNQRRESPHDHAGGTTSAGEQGQGLAGFVESGRSTDLGLREGVENPLDHNFQPDPGVHRMVPCLGAGAEAEEPRVSTSATRSSIGSWPCPGWPGAPCA